MPWGVAAAAAVSAAGSVIGGSQAAGASKAAADAQQKQYQQTRADLRPYVTAGYNVLDPLTALATGSPTGGGPDYVSMAQGKLPGSVFTQADLEATPGYQFTLAQGLKATQSARAAKGLGVSGAALKGAAAYAAGLADSTYSNRFNEAQQNFGDILNLNTAQQGNLTNQYNRQLGVAQLGENAAAQTGVAGTQAAANQGNYMNQAGQAQAAGTMGVGNAFASGANAYLGYQYLNKLLPGTSGYQTGTNPVPGGNSPL